ncbi:MAG: copper homeostasis protein CutC [Bacteroidales bacterium]|nr:copper homeostasis protein CutC [Bacteroidales bacterium]
MKYNIENCSGSTESCVRAQSGGAYRIELCSALEVGGLTPSYGLMKRAREAVTIKINAMIRPRCGDFLYSEREIAEMIEDIHVARVLKMDGVVFGCLTPKGQVDIPLMKRLMAECKGLDVTFHRAFDMCSDLSKALEDVISVGCNRILSSGGAQTAPEGVDNLAKLVKQADNRIIIMPGSGVNAGNIHTLLEITGAKEYHLSGMSIYDSGMVYRNPKINMGGTTLVDEYGTRMTDTAKIKAAVDAVNA